MEVKYEKYVEQEQLRLLARKSYIHPYIFLSFLLNKYNYYILLYIIIYIICVYTFVNNMTHSTVVLCGVDNGHSQ